MQLTKVKRPWFVPAWIWNKGIAMGAEHAKSEARVEKIASLAGDKAADLLERAVQGKDPAKVKTVCENCSRAARLFERMSSALADGEVSGGERLEIAGELEKVVEGFVTQDAIDAKIDEIAAALRS